MYPQPLQRSGYLLYLTAAVMTTQPVLDIGDLHNNVSPDISDSRLLSKYPDIISFSYSIKIKKIMNILPGETMEFGQSLLY